MIPLTLVTLLSACTKWATWGGPDALYTTRALPDRARVTYEQAGVERIVILHGARVLEDSLIGALLETERGFEDDHEPSGRLAIALTDVTRIQEKRTDLAGTALTVVAGVALGVALGVLLICAAVDVDDSDSWDC